eukprot:scaffold17162_cov151-Isochrysis_galbana.AAC.1
MTRILTTEIGTYSLVSKNKGGNKRGTVGSRYSVETGKNRADRLRFKYLWMDDYNGRERDPPVSAAVEAEVVASQAEGSVLVLQLGQPQEKVTAPAGIYDRRLYLGLEQAARQGARQAARRSRRQEGGCGWSMTLIRRSVTEAGAGVLVRREARRCRGG